MANYFPYYNPFRYSHNKNDSNRCPSIVVGKVEFVLNGKEYRSKRRCSLNKNHDGNHKV